MPLAPDPGSWHDQYSRDSHAAKMIAGQERRGGECDFLIVGDCHGVRGEDGAEGCAEDCDEGEDGEDEIAAP